MAECCGTFWTNVDAETEIRDFGNIGKDWVHTYPTEAVALPSTTTLTEPRDSSDGSSVYSSSHPPTPHHLALHKAVAEPCDNPPPESEAAPSFQASTSTPAVADSPDPPSFSSLFLTPSESTNKSCVNNGPTGTASPPPPVPASPAASPAPPFEPQSSSLAAAAQTKAALPRDTKEGYSNRDLDDGEPPPPYTEGSSPLEGFTYVMAAAGGAASIITQVSQGGGPPITSLSGPGSDEHITMELRGTRFTLSRDELLTLPEFVLLSLFPNGLLPDGHMNYHNEGDVYPVDVSMPNYVSSSTDENAPQSKSPSPSSVQWIKYYLWQPAVYLSDSLYESQYDPASLQFMLDFFRAVAQSIPTSDQQPTDTPALEHPNEAVPIEPSMHSGSAREMLQDRAGIIVLREDLDFYTIPPRKDIEQPEMIEIKRAAGRALLKQDGIFSGLRRSEEPGTTEQHLIEMLTAGGFNHDDRWGHRAGEPNKAVICSLALARLRTEQQPKPGGVNGDVLVNGNNGSGGGATAVGMAQKLLLFWRKPARRCWWEGVELEGVEGVEGRLKVWIRRVWTLEMVGLPSPDFNPTTHVVDPAVRQSVIGLR
ncbi:MAG: hypothetical protein M1821_007025 [Bathelium mastoideum]|nr:MAG: hypothetical protein M1821_007025 [Bathelium mastoideum]